MTPRKKKDWIFNREADVCDGLSGAKIDELMDHAYVLIGVAEAMRGEEFNVVNPFGIDTRDVDPWATFPMHKKFFKLRYEETQDGRRFERTYTLMVAAPPPPSAGPSGSGDDAAAGDSGGSGGAPKPPKPKDGKGSAGSRSAAQPEAGPRAPKQTDKRIADRFMSYKLNIIKFARKTKGALTVFSSQLRTTIETMAKVCGSSIIVARDWTELTHDRLRSVAAATRALCNSLGSLAEVSPHVFGPGARLEPRLFGQSSGLHLLLYTFVRDDQPIDWSANLFGAPPEEERLCI